MWFSCMCVHLMFVDLKDLYYTNACVFNKYLMSPFINVVSLKSLQRK